MRAIAKHAEPQSLTEYRAAPGATYDGYPDKDLLRKSLVTEQRGLCCYCLARIRDEPGRMKIEHWHSQTRYETEQLAYANLLGACRGNEGRSPNGQHCDTRKGDRDLSRNPANPAHRIEAFVRFHGDGRISSNDASFDNELNYTLNLNAPILVNRRKAVLDAFKDALPKRGPIRRPILKKWLRDWNGEETAGDLKPFCQVAVYWLRKRIARL